MKIGNLYFENFVFGQSGVQGSFGEPDEYPSHKWCNLFKNFSFEGMVFVAKTITTEPKIYPETSNTELVDVYKLKKTFPKSIWFSIKSIIIGYILNAVGLPNPGAKIMFFLNKWQKRKDTFMISFSPTGETLRKKVIDTEKFCNIFLNNWNKVDYSRHCALQINFSCPNTGHDQKQDPYEIITILSIIRQMIPELSLIPKFNLLVEPEVIVALKPYCEAFCLTNTLPFGEKEPEEWWNKLFSKGKSPLLKHFGGKFSGGLSGAPLFPLLVKWLERMEDYDNSVIILAGGGIMRKRDIEKLSHFKIVKAIALGSVASLRPWRLQPLINHGNEVFGRKYFLE